jgi:hypothetical protein
VVAASLGPFVVLLSQDGADQPELCGAIGSAPSNARDLGRRLTLLRESPARGTEGSFDSPPQRGMFALSGVHARCSAKSLGTALKEISTDWP